MGSEKPVNCVQSSVKEMFPLFKWEAGNIGSQRKQFIKKKSKIISKCHHQNKYMLRTLASKIQNPDVTYFYAVIFNVRTFNIVVRLKIVFHNLQANEWCYYKHSYIKSNSLFVTEMLCQHLIRPSTTDCKTTTNIYKQSFIK